MRSKEIGGGYNRVSQGWIHFVKHMFPLFICVVYVCVCVPLSPGFTVCVCVCLSESEPMDGSHSFWPECDGQWCTALLMWPDPSPSFLQRGDPFSCVNPRQYK